MNIAEGTTPSDVPLRLVMGYVKLLSVSSEYLFRSDGGEE
jgi:hypothetical protein